GRAQALRPWGLPPVELAEDDPAEEVVRDHAGALDEREHRGGAAHRVAGAEDLVELGLVVDAVLEREDGGLGTDDGADTLSGRLRVERLHAEEDDVGAGEVADVLHGRGTDDPLALDGGSDAQPVAPDRREVLAACDQRDRLAGARELRAAFPEDGILAGERGARLGRSGRRWIIDPLDGTTNYAHGLPIFGVSIGLEADRRVEVGVVFDPNRDELFVAERGRGATVNGQPLAVSAAATLGESLLATGFPYNIRETADNNLREYAAFAVRTRGVRRMGSAVLYLAWLATGRLDGYWELTLGPWDAAAGSLLVEEAGGRVTNLTGGALDLDAPALVASNGRIHDALLAVLTEVRG